MYAYVAIVKLIIRNLDRVSIQILYRFPENSPVFQIYLFYSKF